MFTLDSCAQLMECGETDFSSLLDDQRGKPLNMSFVALYWQQVSDCFCWLNDVCFTILNWMMHVPDVRGSPSGARAKSSAFRSQTGQLRPCQGPPQDHRFRDCQGYSERHRQYPARRAGMLRDHLRNKCLNVPISRSGRSITCPQRPFTR